MIYAWRSGLQRVSRHFGVMGTEAQLIVVTDDVESGEEAVLRGEEDLRETERILSRFREDSDLSLLNRYGSIVGSDRLRTAIVATVEAYELTSGIIDPRVIGSLEAIGYDKGLPQGEIEAKPGRRMERLGETDMSSWLSEDSRRITLAKGVRLDLAGVGKALGIGWAAEQLVGHAGLLVDVGGDIIALGTDSDGGCWRVGVDHGGAGTDVAGIEGSPLAVATSTTEKRSWKSGGRAVHHLIDPRTGEPSDGEFRYATVSAQSILEADIAAKLVILEGRDSLHFFSPELHVVATDAHGTTTFFSGGAEA